MSAGESMRDRMVGHGSRHRRVFLMGIVHRGQHSTMALLACVHG